MKEKRLLMQIIQFQLRQDEDFIPLMQLLKAVNVVYSGSEAAHLITSGQVLRNGTVETRKRAKITAGEEIRLLDFHISVTN